jgi:hypothetical protein
MFAWPLAIRLAVELGDGAVVEELLALLDGYPVGHLPPLLRAERSLARARIRAAEGDPNAGAAIEAAIAEFRAVARPYHLANALLDQADYLYAQGQGDEAEVLQAEARAIGERLGAGPVIDRADATAATRVG